MTQKTPFVSFFIAVISSVHFRFFMSTSDFLCPLPILDFWIFGFAKGYRGVFRTHHPAGHIRMTNDADPKKNKKINQAGHAIKASTSAAGVLSCKSGLIMKDNVNCE